MAHHLNSLPNTYVFYDVIDTVHVAVQYFPQPGSNVLLTENLSAI